MIASSDKYNYKIFSARFNGETILVSVGCVYEYEICVICEECGRRDVVEINRVFDCLNWIMTQRDSKINRWDKKVLESIENDLSQRLARDVCLTCNEGEKRINRSANMSTNPLGI